MYNVVYVQYNLSEKCTYNVVYVKYECGSVLQISSCLPFMPLAVLI
jgi:hypothetical protein